MAARFWSIPTLRSAPRAPTRLLTASHALDSGNAGAVPPSGTTWHGDGQKRVQARGVHVSTAARTDIRHTTHKRSLCGRLSALLRSHDVKEQLDTTLVRHEIKRLPSHAPEAQFRPAMLEFISPR